ncbi:YitT family protein [Lacrimispora saccharolytica]|nr:YitT family protein [Lacrimispora saccharolytica]
MKENSGGIHFLKTLPLILLGNTVYALGIVMFVLPTGLITGGTTGLALTAEYFLHIPVSVFVFLMNLCMFLLGAAVLGMKFALTTLVSSFYYPLILGVLQKIPVLSDITKDPMLATVFGGLMIGFGIGIVIRAGASTGGMDIPPLILKKKFGLPVSVMLYVFDVTILILQMLFSDKEEILYGILLVMIYTVVLDKVLLIGTSQTQVKIVSKKYMELNEKIIHELDRGSTLIHATTGFMKKEQPMVMTVISNRELGVLNRLVMETDPQAFMIVGNVNEVKGRGFTQEKVYKKEKTNA